ncbi:hypothetical protein MASR2M8_12690 [Opitutaceae bacterium]
MSEDRLKELIRQRALLAEHLAWLDREITGVRGVSGSLSLADSVSPAPEPCSATLAASQPRSSLPSAAAAEVDALFDRLQTEEKSRGQFSQRGCWMVFTLLMLAGLVGIAALIFLRYR